MDDSNTGWFFAGVSTVIASLASVVAFLFKMNESKNTAAITALQTRLDQQEKKLNDSDIKHEECQQDREKLSIQVATLTGKLERYIIDQTESRRIEIERNHNQ